MKMSDINDLIHSNAVVAFQQGEKTEQNRIIKLLTDFQDKAPNCPCESCSISRLLIRLIKGEQK